MSSKFRIFEVLCRLPNNQYAPNSSCHQISPLQICSRSDGAIPHPLSLTSTSSVPSFISKISEVHNYTRTSFEHVLILVAPASNALSISSFTQPFKSTITWLAQMRFTDSLSIRWIFRSVIYTHDFCQKNLLPGTLRLLDSFMYRHSFKMTTGLVAAYVTVPNDAIAKKIANSIIEKKLAACVNIIPGIRSVYRWGGKINVRKAGSIFWEL